MSTFQNPLEAILAGPFGDIYFEMLETLPRLVAFGRSCRMDSHHMDWADNSPLARESFSTAKLRYQSGEPWASIELERAVYPGIVAFNQAEDMLIGANALLRSEYSELSFWPVARAGLETLGRSFWVLQPGIGAKKRRLRCLMDQEHNARRMRDMDLLYNGTEQGKLWPVQDPCMKVKAVHHRAQHLGFRVVEKRGVDDKIEHYITGGPGRPEPETAFSYLVDRTGESGITLYSLFSNRVHGTIDAFMNHRVPVNGHGDDLIPREALQRDPLELIFANRVLCKSYEQAFDRVLRLYGWPRQEWASLCSEVSHSVDSQFQSAKDIVFSFGNHQSPGMNVSPS